MSRMTDENWEKLETAKKDSKERYDLKIKQLFEEKKTIEKADLQYRYFRNDRRNTRNNRAHRGVICIGYKIISESEQGIKVAFSVAFCSPKDAFSRYHAKKVLARRYTDGQCVSIHIDYGSNKYITNFIRDIWNGGKVPIEKLGIKNILPGVPIMLKPWMKIIR